MKTAKEYRIKNFNQIYLSSKLTDGDKSKLIVAIENSINEAREEALREAAELCDDFEDRRGEHKVLILSTIKELK